MVGGGGEGRRCSMKNQHAVKNQLLAVLIHPAISSCEGDAVGLGPQLKQIK